MLPPLAVDGILSVVPSPDARARLWSARATRMGDADVVLLPSLSAPAATTAAGTRASDSAARGVNRRVSAACQGKGGHGAPLCQGYPPSRRTDGRGQPGSHRSGCVPACHGGRAVGISELQRVQPPFSRWLQRGREWLSSRWGSDSACRVLDVSPRAGIACWKERSHPRGSRGMREHRMRARPFRSITVVANRTSGRDCCWRHWSDRHERRQEGRAPSRVLGDAASGAALQRRFARRAKDGRIVGRRRRWRRSFRLPDRRCRGLG